MKMFKLNKANQNGRSMVEMLGVLAIIGVLSVGGISGYSKAMAKFKLTKAQDQITMLLMNIRTAYATSPSYDGLDSDMAAEYNIAPTEMVVTGADGKRTLNGAFGGKVEVSALGTNKTYFYISLRALGKEACRSLLTSDWGADGLVAIQVDSDEAFEAPDDGLVDNGCGGGGANGLYCTANLPIGLTNAATDCDNEISYITWVYY